MATEASSFDEPFALLLYDTSGQFRGVRLLATGEFVDLASDPKECKANIPLHSREHHHPLTRGCFAAALDRGLEVFWTAFESLAKQGLDLGFKRAQSRLLGRKARA